MRRQVASAIAMEMADRATPDMIATRLIWSLGSNDGSDVAAIFQNTLQ